MMAMNSNKPLMRCLGEFVGHIVRSVTSNPKTTTHEINRKVEERKDGQVTLRRTTIDEIEIQSEDTPNV
jgi:ribosomal protein L1